TPRPSLHTPPPPPPPPLSPIPPPPTPTPTLLPYTTLFRSSACLPHTLLGLAPTTAIDFGRKTGSSVSVVVDSDVFCKVVDLLDRSEEHTSELQPPYDLVCRLLLEKKK